MDPAVLLRLRKIQRIVRTVLVAGESAQSWPKNRLRPNKEWWLPKQRYCPARYTAYFAEIPVTVEFKKRWNVASHKSHRLYSQTRLLPFRFCHAQKIGGKLMGQFIWIPLLLPPPPLGVRLPLILFFLLGNWGFSLLGATQGGVANVCARLAKKLEKQNCTTRLSWDPQPSCNASLPSSFPLLPSVPSRYLGFCIYVYCPTFQKS